MATQKKTKVTSLEEIREIIDQHRPELKRQFHVDKIGVFGSYARGGALHPQAISMNPQCVTRISLKISISIAYQCFCLSAGCAEGRSPSD